MYQARVRQDLLGSSQQIQNEYKVYQGEHLFFVFVMLELKQGCLII